METISGNTLPVIPSTKRQRRRHSPEFRAEVVTACSELGASVAAVAQRYQLNANLVHKWRKAARHNEPPCAESAGFVALPLNTPAVTTATDHERVTFVVNQITIQWPLRHIQQAVPWLKALQS